MTVFDGRCKKPYCLKIVLFINFNTYNVHVCTEFFKLMFSWFDKKLRIAKIPS